MQFLFNIINVPFSYVLKFFSDIFGGSFAAAVFFFTLLINLILIPLTIKSQKSSVQQTRIKPKLDDLRARYGDDKQKIAEETQKLYQAEGVSMSGGCLPMIVRMLLIFSIYYLIMSPLTYLEGVNKNVVSNVTEAVSSGMTELKKSDPDRYDELSKEIALQKSNVNQLTVVKLVREYPDAIKEIVGEEEYAKIEDDFNTIVEKDKENRINYTLFGVDLTEKPVFSFDIFHDFQIIWLLPIFAFLAQMLTSVISMMIQKKNMPEAPNMAGMMLTMPLLSLFIGFTFPGGVCFYWICSSLIGGLIQSVLQLFYGPHRMLARERAKELGKRCDFEKKQLEKFNGVSENIK